MAEARSGERYTKVDGQGSIWEVVAIQVDPNGIRHWRIVNVNDRTNTKVISEKTLTNRRFYRLCRERVMNNEGVE